MSTFYKADTVVPFFVEPRKGWESKIRGYDNADTVVPLFVGFRGLLKALAAVVDQADGNFDIPQKTKKLSRALQTTVHTPYGLRRRITRHQNVFPICYCPDTIVLVVVAFFKTKTIINYNAQ